MNPFKIIFLLLISHSIYSQIELWGVTSSGGQFNSGTIFKYLPETNTHTVVHSFNNCEGQPRVNNLIKTSAGRYVGTSDFGGSFGIGTISEFDEITNTFTILHSFDFNTGYIPIGKLIESSNGQLYGVTQSGGINDWGVLFSFNLTTNTFSKLFDFVSNDSGKYPTGPLVLNNDFIYGTTSSGGINNFGVLFKFDSNSNLITKVLDFDGTNNGKNPNNSLMKASNGNFYGDTKKGGLFDKGVIFEYNPSNNLFTKKIDLDGITIGENLIGSMVEPADGLLYGISDYKTSPFKRSIFQYNPNTNVLTKKSDMGDNDYIPPKVGFTVGLDDKLYYYKYSRLFSYNYQQNTVSESSLFSGNINSILFEPTLGNFWLAVDYTTENCLTEFNSSTNLFTKKYFFGKSLNGYRPQGELLLAKDENFYGVLGSGGVNGKGSIYKFDPKTNEIFKKVEFNSEIFSAYDGLIQATSGKFYGTTELGYNNINGNGIINPSGLIYEFNPDLNSIQKLNSFAENNLIHYAASGKMLEVGDKFYGLSEATGVNFGKIYEFDPLQNSITNKASFNIDTGEGLYGSLIKANNEKLYGMTLLGSHAGLGSIFEYTLNSSQIDLKIPFLANNNFGGLASGDLLQAKNGLLYGLASKGGDNDLGVLFMYDITSNIYSKKFDFNNFSSGNSPQGSLIQALDNNLYGYGFRGGLNNRGTIFKFNINTNLFTKLFDFNGLNGTNPNSALTQRIATITTTKSGNWNDPTVWENGIVPSNTSYITINTNHIIDIDGVPIAIKYVEVKGTLNFSNGGSLNLVE